MTDYAELRAALEAGPTPGPWKVSSESDYPSAIDGPNDQEVLAGCGCCGSPNLTKKDADHIAACDPNTIRALLAERDALRHAIEAAMACGMIPKSSTQDGGASGYSRQVQVADMIRAALAQEHA